MEALMILMVIAVFFINFIFIDNIYKIVDNKTKPFEITKKDLNCSVKDALIIGDDGICQKIISELKKHNIQSDIIYDIDDIDKTYPYKYVLAAFNDDLENLTVASISINMMGITNIVAICNKEHNQRIYDENHIITIHPHASAFDIVSILLIYHNKWEA